MCLVDILNGKIAKEISPTIYLFMFMCVTSMSTREIKEMNHKDFMILAPMVELVFRRKFEVKVI